MQEVYEQYMPTMTSWVTAILCTFLLIVLILAADSFATGTHLVNVQTRLLKIIEDTKKPELILDDTYVKSLSEKKVLKIEKIIAIHNAIKEDNFERAKILINDSFFKKSSKVSQLITSIDELYKIQKDKKIQGRIASLPSEDVQKQMKTKAIELSLALFKEESLPKINALNEFMYKTITKILAFQG